jgi:hypothetical protein
LTVIIHRTSWQNRSESRRAAAEASAVSIAWTVLFLLGSYLYFKYTAAFFENKPALLLPSMIPISIFSAWVSWQIEEAIEPTLVESPVDSEEASILPLLYMSVLYSSVVEGFLYEWVLHGQLRPWIRIAIDLFVLSPFFADPAATYVYKRFLGESHRVAKNYVAIRLPTFIVPLLAFWTVFSVLGNVIANPILSFMTFNFGIIVWTVFFTWANHVELPELLKTSRHRFLRRLGRLNDRLSEPLERVYSHDLFGSYLVDLLFLTFCLAIASELWLAGVASSRALAIALAAAFAVWKGFELRSKKHQSRVG